MKNLLFITLILTIGSICFANSAPVVSNVTVSQRTDGSCIVDIYYTLSDADNDRCTVNMAVSDDGGSSWAVTATSLSGDIGENISSGFRQITWNSKADLPGVFGTDAGQDPFDVWFDEVPAALVFGFFLTPDNLG